MTTVNNCHIKENWHQPRRRGNGLCPHRDWATADDCQCAYACRQEIGSSGTWALSGGSLFCSACTKEQETAAAFNESNRLLRGRFRTNLCAEWDWPCMGKFKTFAKQPQWSPRYRASKCSWISSTRSATSIRALSWPFESTPSRNNGFLTPLVSLNKANC